MAKAANENGSDYFGQWVRLNQRLAQESASLFRALGERPGSTREIYRRSLKTVHEAVDETLRLEREALQDWERRMPSPPPFQGLFQLGIAFTRAGIDIRSKLWGAWSKSLEELDPAQPHTVFNALKDPTALFTAWKDVADSAFHGDGAGTGAGKSGLSKAAASRKSAAG